ncbi:MAG: hypothetical protein ACXAC2_04555, partial [Candidatus Kariarchaeaceae archaeon]
LGDQDQPSLLPELEQIMLANGLNAQVLAIKKLPVELDAYYRGKKDLEYKRWMDFYQKQDKTYWYRIIMRVRKYKPSENDKERLTYIEMFRTDFSKLPKIIDIKSIQRNMNHYLSDLDSIMNMDSEKFVNISYRLAKEVAHTKNFQKSVTEYGKDISELFPEIFPNPGSAIRFWGQLTSNFWQPKYLERKLW